jgi:MFS family permease
VSEEFHLRSIAVAAYGPATLFGLAQGSMLPVIALSAIDRGASPSIAALISALLGIGSIVTNIPSGILATRIGERKSMLVAAIATTAGLAPGRCSSTAPGSCSSAPPARSTAWPGSPT